MTPDPYRTPDPETLTRIDTAIAGMTHAILACHDPAGHGPLMSRIACQRLPDGRIMALLSGLAGHSHALAADPRAGLFITPAAGQSRNPMAAARLSLQCRARKEGPPTAAQRHDWLARDPLAQVFIDLPDFTLWHLTVTAGLWNAGFGRAFRLTHTDLPPAPASDSPPA